MGLIGNYSVLNKTAGSFVSGATIAQTRANFNDTNKSRNFLLHTGKLASIPSGYGMNAWVPPQVTGQIASFTQSYLVISPAVNLAGGRNLEITANSVISATNADLEQIVTLLATSLTIFASSAELNASISLQASGILELTTLANIQAVVTSLASSSMVITSNTILTALAHMNAEAGGPTPLSPEGLAEAVWAKDISSYVESGTAGLKLNNASSAGNPWEAELATNNTVGTFGYLVQKLLTVAKFLGLK